MALHCSIAAVALLTGASQYLVTVSLFIGWRRASYNSVDKNCTIRTLIQSITIEALTSLDQLWASGHTTSCYQIVGFYCHSTSILHWSRISYGVSAFVLETGPEFWAPYLRFRKCVDVLIFLLFELLCSLKGAASIDSGLHISNTLGSILERAHSRSLR